MSSAEHLLGMSKSKRVAMSSKDQRETEARGAVEPHEWDVELDALGMLCPLPVLKARKALLAMEAGQVLRLLASDRAAVIDVPHFCTQTGYEFLGARPCALPDTMSAVQDELQAQAYFIRRT